MGHGIFGSGIRRVLVTIIFLYTIGIFVGYNSLPAIQPVVQAQQSFPSSRVIEPSASSNTTANIHTLPSGNLSSENGPVSILSSAGLIKKLGHYVDLEGKTLRFTPTGDTGYSVQALSLDFSTDWGTQLDYKTASSGGPIYGWRTPIPFVFSFGGQSWSEMFVNLYGNISFGQPEGVLWQQRDLPGSGEIGMRSVASAIDARSTAGAERIIAPFWANYVSETTFKYSDSGANQQRKSTVFVNTTSQISIITWKVVRDDYYLPLSLGYNIFQARLFPSGIIELAYQHIAEGDGIVGVFPGTSVNGMQLDYVNDTGDVSDTTLDITTAVIVDAGSNIRFTVTMNSAIPTSSLSKIQYRIFFDEDPTALSPRCEFGLIVQEKQQFYNTCSDSYYVAFSIDGNSLTMFLSKIDLEQMSQFSWSLTVERSNIAIDRIAGSGMRRSVNLTSAVFGEQDLSATTGNFSGNIIEVFHYPSFPKRPDVALRTIYKQYPPNDDIALIFTDFRIDELGAGFGSTTISNDVQGIGVGTVRNGSQYGSDKLQVTMTPVYIGAGRFAELVERDNIDFQNYSFAVGVISHEIAHRWLAYLHFRNQQTGQIQGFDGEDCSCHWTKYLHAPSFFPVSYAYTDIPYSAQEHSPMGGGVWHENTDGTFTEDSETFGPPAGFSALDLYAMGLVAPEEMPDTFVLQNPYLIDNNSSHVRATKVPIRIADIIEAMGPRIPSSATSQKEFTFSIYLATDSDRAVYPDMLARTEGISGAIAKYFSLATRDRMLLSFVPRSNSPVANYRLLTTKSTESVGGILSASALSESKLTYTIVSNPSKGVVTLEDPSTGAFVYTPNYGASGHDSFLFQANDGAGNSNVAAVTITINNSLFLPVIKR